MAAGHIQLQPDSTGKRVGNVPVRLPVGTIVVDGDGVETALTTATTVFLQRVVLTDSTGVDLDWTENDRQQEIIDELQRIRRGIGKMCGDSFLEED
jgi:hypothetical protein